MENALEKGQGKHERSCSNPLCFEEVPGRPLRLFLARPRLTLLAWHRAGPLPADKAQPRCHMRAQAILHEASDTGYSQEGGRDLGFLLGHELCQATADLRPQRAESETGACQAGCLTESGKIFKTAPAGDQRPLEEDVGEGKALSTWAGHPAKKLKPVLLRKTKTKPSNQTAIEGPWLAEAAAWT